MHAQNPIPLPLNFDWPTLPIGQTKEGSTWLTFWQAQSEWTAKVGIVFRSPEPPVDDER